MGSLPNLSELGREEYCISSYKLGSAIGQSNYGGVDILSQEEKNRILHRHSGYGKNSKVKRNAQPTNVDDLMLEQMASYSPISSRSTRCHHSIRRRDSINSSIGATSVRKLIGVVRSASGKSGPIYSRRVLIKNLLALCLSHVFLTSTFLPFLALQGSVSLWVLPLPGEKFPITINAGSVLLMILHCAAAISAIVGPPVIQKVGSNGIFAVGYLVFAVFYALHVYPVLYVLIPGYVILGVVLGPITMARITFLMTLSTKMSCVCSEDDEEAKISRRTCIVRRVSRAFQAAHDFGFILGSVLSAVIITYSFNVGLATNSTILMENFNASKIVMDFDKYQTENETNCSLALRKVNCTECVCSEVNEDAKLITLEEYNSYLDDIFDVDEIGDRLCGSQACPSSYRLKSNATSQTNFFILPKNTAATLISIYVFFALTALVVTVVGMDRIKMFVHQDPLERSEGFAALRAVRESFKDLKLQLAAPLAFFIGLEQSFMYSDFSKSYVVCTLGIHRLNLVFLCMGLLQSIAACTLSMLLRNIRRYYLIAVGFTFHICLLMVQMIWKPISDDPALFYVISAAWGVCNAIWEMLNYTLLTGLYADNWEPAFANSTFFKFLGLAVAFGFHGLLCNWLKVYLLGFFMVAAIIPYGWLEIKLENIRRIKNISRL